MKKLRVAATLSFLALQLAMPVLVMAQDPGPPVGEPPRDLCGVIQILNGITNWLLIFLVVVAIIFIILAAFKYLTAGGDATKISAANKQLLLAVVAVAVGLLAKGVPFIVGAVTGVDIGEC